MPSGACCSGDDYVIEEGPGIRVTGTGTPSNPWKISSDTADLSNALEVRDTSTIDFAIRGAGVVGDPFILQATFTGKVTDLIDVDDPNSRPNDGEALIWVGTPTAGHWEFKTPPPAPAGAVNAGAGLSGAGTAGSQLVVAVSGTWGAGQLAGLGADSTIGQPVYADSNGQLRVKPLPSSSTVSWSTLSGKPSTFPPSAHSHVASDISAAEQAKLNVGKIDGQRITTTTTSSTAPSGPAVGDVWLFPKGS